MTDTQSSYLQMDSQEEDLLAIYGGQDDSEDLAEETRSHRKEFKPWHHPVKQIVRKHQWAAQTKRFLESRDQGGQNTLKYFTLPGSDMLDVRVLADICEPMGVKIQYFGFNAKPSTEENDQKFDQHATWASAESALRQAGRVTEDALVLSDRLEDIAVPNSQAAIQLGQRSAFDIINIDACDHLAYKAKGRDKNIFDALGALLVHQLKARTPWLLFVTTRVEPDLLGEAGLRFQEAINQNLLVKDSSFGATLAQCLEVDEGRVAAELSSIWRTHDERFLKLYTIGLGKFLLQFFHGQPNLPANVELASVYSYCVYGDKSDMLALVFRVTPDEVRVFSPNVGGAALIPNLEPARAVKIATQVVKMQNLDFAINNDSELRQAAVAGTEALLGSANYDLAAWREWLASHEQRPMQL